MHFSLSSSHSLIRLSSFFLFLPNDWHRRTRQWYPFKTKQTHSKTKLQWLPSQGKRWSYLGALAATTTNCYVLHWQSIVGPFWIQLSRPCSHPTDHIKFRLIYLNLKIIWTNSHQSIKNKITLERPLIMWICPKCNFNNTKIKKLNEHLYTYELGRRANIMTEFSILCLIIWGLCIWKWIEYRHFTLLVFLAFMSTMATKAEGRNIEEHKHVLLCFVGWPNWYDCSWKANYSALTYATLPPSG